MVLGTKPNRAHCAYEEICKQQIANISQYSIEKWYELDIFDAMVYSVYASVFC